MEAIKYSDTADGLSRMSKEEYKEKFIFLKKQKDKWNRFLDFSFPLVGITTTVALILLLSQLSDTTNTIGWTIIVLNSMLSVFSLIALEESSDNLSVLSAAAPEEARILMNHLKNEEYLRKVQPKELRKSTRLAKKLHI